MNENICTIPVNEVFEQKCGCPICTMRNLIETKYIEYITGAAMMEPDIRLMTNASGFCERHYSKMLEVSAKRLPIALMLDTHLKEIDSRMLEKPDKASIERLEKLENSCFVCDYMDRHLSRHIDTVLRTYKAEEEFRGLFAGQDYLCLPHYRMLLAQGKKQLGGLYKEFCATAHTLVSKRARLLEEDFAAFIAAFDYRSAGEPMPEQARDVIERTIAFLTSRDAKNS